MKDLITVAMAKVIKGNEAKRASSNLREGEHSIDCLIRLKGKIKKAKDYEQRIVQKADPWGILAVALSLLNDVSVASLVKRSQGEEVQSRVKWIKEEAKEAMNELKEATWTTCNGAVTTELVAEELIEVVDDIKKIKEILLEVTAA